MPPSHDDAPAIELRVLGDVAVAIDGEQRPVSRPREQAVLARLALAVPHPVPVDVLVTDIWGDDPSSGVVDSLRVHVSNLRKLLSGGPRPAGEVLVTTPGAYRFDVPPSAVDALRLDAACRAGDVGTLRALLGSWPAQDLARFDPGSGFFAASARWAEDLRAEATHLVADDDLSAEHVERAIDRLEELLRRRPHRERSWELLIRALYAAGRRTEALRAAQRAREALAEVGIEPAAGLIAAEQAVFAGGDASAAAVPRPSGDYVDVEGSRVAYAAMGTGPHDLLFLHGGFVPFEVMPDEPRLGRFLGALCEAFRVILVDRRGIGMSDPPADGSPVTIEHWVADCGAVLDAVGSTRPLVLAHENGGPVALRLAAEQPARVRGLILHSTAARPLRGPDHPYGPSGDVYAWVGRMLDRQLGESEVLQSVAPSAGDDPGLRSWLDRAGRLGAGPTRAAELHRTYLDADVRSVLGDVRAPTIVLQPARRIRSDPGQARYLVAQLPDAELQMLDSGDHLPWLADAGTVVAAVRRLDERTRTGAPPAPTLRALVGVCPPVGAAVLLDHGAETCVQLPDAMVATFTSRAAAQEATEAMRRYDPQASTCVDVADTDATAGDPAVAAVAARVRTEHDGTEA